MKRITRFMPAWDKRDDDPKKNYGIGCVKCVMVLVAEKGAVHFIFGTGMYLPETMQEYAGSGKLTTEMYGDGKYFMFASPMGYDVGYHSPTPMFEGQEPANEKCEWIDAPCYSDGSALRAEKWMEVIIREGDEKIWAMLEQEYKDTFIKDSK